jgi:hypothetical protein
MKKTFMDSSNGIEYEADMEIVRLQELADMQPKRSDRKKLDIYINQLLSIHVPNVSSVSAKIIVSNLLQALKNAEVNTKKISEK